MNSNTTKNGIQSKKGHGVRGAKAKAGTARASDKRRTSRTTGGAAVALLPWSGRASRVATFRRLGGVLIASGPVIAVGWREGERERAADLRTERERGAAAARAAATLKRATAAGAAVTARLLGDLPAREVAEYSATVAVVAGGDLAARLEARCAAEWTMGKRAKLTANERAAVAAARRARRIARAAVSSQWPFVAAVAPTAPAPSEWHGGNAVTQWRGPELVAISESGAGRLVRLCAAAGKAWAASWERQGGRAIEGSDVEELCAIYHAQLATVAAMVGEVPGSLAIIFAHRGGDTMSARALRAYRRGVRKAGTLCRSYVWGKGREVCTFESREHAAYNAARERGQLETVSTGQSCLHSSPLPGELAAEQARVRSPYVRRLCSLYGDALRAFWMLSGSRKWRAGLASDLRTLATAAKVARGEGLAALGSQYLGDGESANEALRRALCDLRKHIAAGRALSANGATVSAVESVLEARRALRRRESGGDCSPSATRKGGAALRPVAGGCLTARLWARQVAALLRARQ